jgi:2-iminobutanoate/2-iminopropanoate deaminase
VGPTADISFSDVPRAGPEAFKIVQQEEKMNSRAYSLALISAGLMTLIGLSAAAESKEYLKGSRPQERGYSEAVITEGGRMVWLAGQTATVDDNGNSLASDLDGQVRQLFKNLDRTLQKADGKLSDMVQMTVFITDVRYGDRLTQIRREVFGDNFPGSALITITALAVPNAKIEIQGYAVVGGN